MNKFELISIGQAEILAMKSGYIVVDLRSEMEFYESHIANAINIPNASIREINKFGRKKDNWILYCRRGSLSFRLANEMSDNGYKVMAVVGGYKI